MAFTRVRRKRGQQMNPELDAYNRGVRDAFHLIVLGTKKEPEWFWDPDYQEILRTVAKTIGRTDEPGVQTLMSLVLGCDLALSKPTGLQPKAISEKLKQLRNYLSKAQKCLDVLRDALRPEQLTVESTSHSENLQDGSILIAFGSDPYEELAASIACFNDLSDGFTPALGKREQIITIAVCRIEGFAKSKKPQIPHAELADILDQLLGPVRHRHGQKSRADFADTDDVSRFHHLLRRSPQRRVKKGTPSRLPRSKKDTKPAR